MKKIMMIATILVAGLMFMPNVFAYQAGTYGNVTDATNGDSRITGEANITTEGNTTYAKYSSSDFNFVGADSNAAGERPGDVAWVGIKVDYPAEVSKGTYEIYVNGTKYDDGERQDSFYRDYFGITPQNLENAIRKGTLLEYKVEFDWDKDAEHKIDQVVLIQIDPMTVQLYKEPGKATPVWTNAMAEQIKQEVTQTPSDKPAEQQKTEETPKGEGNPDTSDINLYLLLGLIITSGCGIAYTFKKRFN